MIIRDEEDATPLERASALTRLEVERKRRAVSVIDADTEVRFQAVWQALLFVAKPTLFSVPLTDDEVTQASALYTLAQEGLVLQAANDAIALRISTMDVAEARAFDPATAQEWPS